MKLLIDGSLERENFVDTIPFEYKKDLIVVQALINGEKDRHTFIIDTGAFDSKIEIGVAKELKLPTKATKKNSTAQGISQSIDITQIEAVKLGQTEFSNISAGKLAYDPGSASKCIAPSGIIGANLMKLAHWKIDYEGREIQFSDRPFEIQKGAFSLDFSRPLLSGTPEVEIEVAGRTVSGVLFDIGYNGGLILPSRLLHSFPLDSQQVYFDQSTSGIFGANTDTLTTKWLDVALGGNKINIPVEFSSIGKALLGNDILEHFDITIDYDANRISLYPRSKVQVEVLYSFIPATLNDSLWVVNRTTSELPFSLGDTLANINGKKPTDLYASFCDYFLNVHQLLETDSLLITRPDGSAVTLRPRKSYQ
ncbi:MAG: hypothetical protein GVY08_08880 [Bacteroidetes bacterium]|nr:hypothetical protein [Bacteroidota bacterium]